jgi:hypothetical protein
VSNETQRNHDICEVEDEPKGAQHKAPATSERGHQGVARALDHAVRPTVHGEVLLASLDFPDYFVDMAHPEDYVVSERRMDPYLIENTVPHHHRLLLRVSLEARPDTFAVMTFVLDTGASSAVYFGRRAMQLMHEVGRLREDDLGVVYLDTPLGRCAVLETPATHQPANILGLDMLKKLKLQLGLPPVLGTNVPYL